MDLRQNKREKYRFNRLNHLDYQLLLKFWIKIKKEVIQLRKYICKRYNKTNSHMFASSVERFREKGCKEDLGPGSYEVN